MSEVSEIVQPNVVDFVFMAKYGNDQVIFSGIGVIIDLYLTKCTPTVTCLPFWSCKRTHREIAKGKILICLEFV